VSDFSIHGFCDERFSAVRAAFEKNFRVGDDLGGAFALAIHGELVVDLWGGYADASRSELWNENTLITLSSSYKIAVAICSLMLVERGLIGLDDPVSRYWPEFGCNGKQVITMRQILCHSSGVAGFDQAFYVRDLYDWDRIIKCLETQSPWWEPGTQSGYHGLTFGFLLGELVRRTTGLSYSEFLRTELTEPISADFHVSVPETEFPRIAEVVSDGTERDFAPPDSISARANSPMMLEQDITKVMNTEDWYTAEVPAANGIGNARSMAKIGSVLANRGALYDNQFLSPELVTQAHTEQSYTEDLVMLAPVRYGLGFGLASAEVPIPFPNAMHWGGFGGSTTVMIPEHRAAFSYVTNYFNSGEVVDTRNARLNSATVATLLNGK
jgi:CubicO group peptidase (beta-lactamase class C family)